MGLSMFIDPGLGGTGLAVFQDIAEGRIEPPIYFDRITLAKDSGTWLERSIQTVQFVRKHVLSTNSATHGRATWDNLVVEFPEVWSGSLKSNTAVRGGKHGNAPLLKLANLAGMITYGFMMEMKNGMVRVNYISPASWKGQLPKDLVIQRIKTAYPQIFTIRDHEADAVGMGLSVQKGGKV